MPQADRMGQRTRVRTVLRSWHARVAARHEAESHASSLGELGQRAHLHRVLQAWADATSQSRLAAACASELAARVSQRTLVQAFVCWRAAHAGAADRAAAAGLMYVRAQERQLLRVLLAWSGEVEAKAAARGAAEAMGRDADLRTLRTGLSGFEQLRERARGLEVGSQSVCGWSYHAAYMIHACCNTLPHSSSANALSLARASSTQPSRSIARSFLSLVTW